MGSSNAGLVPCGSLTKEGLCGAAAQACCGAAMPAAAPPSLLLRRQACLLNTGYQPCAASRLLNCNAPSQPCWGRWLLQCGSPMHEGYCEAANSYLSSCAVRPASSPQAASHVLPAGCSNTSHVAGPLLLPALKTSPGWPALHAQSFPHLPLLQASSAMLESDYAMPVKSKKGAIPFFDEDEPEAYCAPAFNSGVVDIEAPMVVGETGEGEEPEGDCVCGAACTALCRRQLGLLGWAAEGA